MQSVGQHSPAPHPLPTLSTLVAALRTRLDRAHNAVAHAPSPFLTVLGLVGVLSGLGVAAFLSRDPREAGAYAVACMMIGGTMAAAGARTRLARPTFLRHAHAPDNHVHDHHLHDQVDTHTGSMREEIEAVAHDLKAPLLSISSYLDLVASGAFGSVSEEAAQALRRAAQLSERAQAVVASALDGKPTDDSEPLMRTVPLARTISEVATALTPSLRGTKASLTVEGVLPSVIGDEDALFRVFTNLVQNAIKYCPDERAPRVTVQARRLSGSTVEVTITDNGCGLPNDATSLTARGTRGSNALGVPGHGLGLATVARLVSRMHGTIAFEQHSGGGTSVRVTLPTA